MIQGQRCECHDDEQINRAEAAEQKLAEAQMDAWEQGRKDAVQMIEFEPAFAQPTDKNMRARMKQISEHILGMANPYTLRDAALKAKEKA